MNNQAQLIAYVDRFSGSGLREFQQLLEGRFAGLFGGVHLLPFFWPIDGADAGFDPVDHTKVDPRLGSYPACFDEVIAGSPAMRTSYPGIGDRWVAAALNEIAPKDDKGVPVTANALSDSDRKNRYRRRAQPMQRT